jgi:signal transduction histidine kinase
MNIFFFDFNNNINILFNNLNISFKAIFNLNNNSNINNEEIIDEVDVVIKYLEEIKNNYNYIYSNKDIYIDNGNKQLFD